MTYVLIAVGLLREISAREPQCVAALLTGLLGIVLTIRTRLVAGIPATRSRQHGRDGVSDGVTASVR